VSAAAAVMSIVAGLAGAVQVAVMSRLGDRVGVVGALAFASTVQVVFAVLLLLLAKRSLDAYGSALRQPAWLWLGGVMGLFIVLTITFAGSRIGTTATVGILIAGQLAMGAAIDRFGLFGGEQISLGWPRVAGIVLLGAGAALSLTR
jgi:transporter family-2 protein